MKVRLYKNKKLIKNTPRPMGLQEPLMYAFFASTADYAFTEGEEIPSAINSEYVMMETEVDDAELNKTYSDAKAEGYQGDITAVAKLMAMHIPLNMRAVDVIPTSNIAYNMIRDALNSQGGSVNNNTWTAFQPSAKIKKWAAYKPFPYKQDFFLPMHESRVSSGLKVSEQKMHGIFAYYELEQVLPKGGVEEPFRLGDFIGYNRLAKDPKLEKGNVKWVDAPDNATGIVDAYSDVAEVHLNITYPDIHPSKVPFPISFADQTNKISVWTYYDYQKKIIYTETFDTKESYQSTKNTKKEIVFEQNFGIPLMGYTSEQTYYLAICGCEVASYKAIIYKRFVQNPSLPECWGTAEVSFPTEYNTYVGAESFKALRTSLNIKDDEIIAVQINNLWCTVGGDETVMYIDAKNMQTGSWIEIARIKTPAGSFPAVTLMNGTSSQIYNGGITFKDYTTPYGSKIKAANGNLKLDKSRFIIATTQFRIRITEIPT